MKPVILVVDDDIAMGELLSDVLGAHAFEVLVCQTGGDALAQGGAAGRHRAGFAGYDPAGYPWSAGASAAAAHAA